MDKGADQQLLIDLQNGDEKALDKLFRAHYAYLCQTVYKVLPDRILAEDLVQEVFYDLWRKREKLNVKQSWRAYLRRAAINRTLNYIRDQKMIVDDESALPFDMSSAEADAGKLMEVDELKADIAQAIESLPERCRLVFGLSRFELMSNKEIAQHLEISIKTVENQMTKALKLLRVRLSDHLLTLFGLFLLAFLPL
ncbi:MAG: RNA polymerase sigma-70 factor [Bacteroidota bacterium]